MTLSPLIKQTIMSQYANSPILMRMIEELSDCIDPSAQIKQFYDTVFNVKTAQGYGLDVWGRIVGLSRNMPIADSLGEYFGFEIGFYPFDQRPFEGGAQSAYALPDEAFRQLVMIKAFSNILYATAPNINRFLKALFNKKCFFTITGHMKATYSFYFALTDFQKHIIYNTDFLPRPCGVEIEIVDAHIPLKTFGFKGSNLQPFNQGTFRYGST